MAFSRSCLLAVFVLFAIVVMLPAQILNPPLTLAQAIDLALKRNPEVILAQAQLDELLGRVKEVRSGAFPQVNFEGFGLRLRDPSILNSSSFDKLPPEFRNALSPVPANLFDLALSVKQPVYTAGKVRTAVNLAEETRLEKAAALEVARQRVAFKVFQAYHDLLLAEENLSVIQETYQQRKKHLEFARARFSQGVATEIDVLRSEVNAANLEPALIRSENRIRLARAGLNNLMVEDLDAPIRLAGKLEYKPVKIEPLEEIQSMGLKSRPELDAARHIVYEAGLYQKLARSENKLAVDLDGRWGYNMRDWRNAFDNNFTRWNITVNFKLPLYDGGRKAGLLVQAQAKLTSAEQNLAQLENGVRLEIKSAYDDLESSAKAFAAAQLNVAQAEKVQKMMQANYQYGAVTTLDVVDSQTALIVAQNARINATYDYELAKARLRLASGRPILDGAANLP